MPAGGVSVGAVYAEAALDISKFQAAAGRLAGESLKIAAALAAAGAGADLAQRKLDALAGLDLSGLGESAGQSMVEGVGQARAAGVAMAQAFASGLQASQAAKGAAAGLITGAMSALTTGAAQARGIGSSFSAGLAAGIAAGRSGVVSAAASVARAAAAAARSALAIHSPSKVTEGLGEYFDMGFVRGVRGGMPKIDRAVAEALYLRPNGAAYDAPAPRQTSSAPVIDYEAMAAANAARPVTLRLDGREVARLNAENAVQSQNSLNRGIAARYGARG